MARRFIALLAASALLTAGAALPASAHAEAGPGPFRFRHLYPEIGSPNAVDPKLGPSKRHGPRLVSPSSVGAPSRTKIPAYAPLGAAKSAAPASPGAAPAAVASVPVGIGPVRNGTFLTFDLADYLELKVNVGSGNAMVRTTEMSLPGIGGNVTTGAAYNSLLHAADVPAGVISPGWRTRVGQDVRLYENSDSSVTYTGPDGVSGVFTLSGSGYSTPKEFKGELSKQSGGGWKYLDHGTGQESYFDSSGLPTKAVDRNDNTTEFGYTSGSLTSITYKPRGESSGRQITIAHYGGDRISTYTQTAGDQSRRVVYTYDSDGRLLQIQLAAGEVMRFGYDTSGDLTSITNGKGHVTELAYDSGHRALSVTRVGASARMVTRLAYPSDTETQVADPNTDQAKPIADVPHTTYTVNDNARVTKTVDPAGKTRSTSYTPFSDIASHRNANGGLTTNTFGANNGESLTKTTAPTGASASLTYGTAPTEHNPTAAYQPSAGTDTQGNTTAYTYDGAGNLSAAKNAAAAQAEVSYNDDGTVKTSTDPANGDNATSYGYDGNHQLASITPPSGNSLNDKTFTYDGYGRLATATDGNGNTTRYRYDANDRVLSVGYSDGTPTVTYTYDKAGNLKLRTDATGTTTWGYTSRNLMAARQSTSGGGEIDWQYDAAGNLVNHIDQLGTRHYVHSTRNLLASMTDPLGKHWEFDYDDDGNRTDTYFNKTSDTAWSMHAHTTYDDSGRITRITSKGTNDDKQVSDISYCYSDRGDATSCNTDSGNDTGLRQWQTDHLTATISDYTYDKGNRLTRATNVAGHTYDYTYDANGNRTTEKTDGTQTQNLSFNSANQVTGNGETFDAAGNQTATTSGGGWTAAYNAAGQTTQITKGGDTTPYTYAGPDQTEMVTAGGTSLVYGRPDDNGIAMIDSYSHVSSTSWIIRDSTGTPLGYSDGSKPFAFATDGLGSVVAIVNQNGNQAGAYTYGPYGETTPGDGWQTGVNLIRYTGGFAEPASGLLKLGHRFYNTDRGRFTQQDNIVKLADPTHANRYAYAACNPTNYTDPTGRFPWGQAIQAGAACLEGGLVAAEAIAPAAGAIGAMTGGIPGGVIEAGAAIGGCAAGALGSWYLGMNIVTGTP